MRILSFNHYWRIVAAGLSYILFGIGGFLPGLYIFALALVPMDDATKQRKVRNAIKNLCRFYVDLMQFLGLMNYDVIDRPNTTFKGHLVISNHSMLIDALFALAYVDDLCCIVKSDLVTNPFTRIPIRLAGYVPNDHELVVELACTKLRQGENVLIFPEGTRNKYDLQLDFRRGAANIAVISNAPILPLVLCCMPRALGKGDPWYQLPDVKSKIVMQFFAPLKTSEIIDTTQPRTKQYRALNASLRNYYYDAVNKVIA